MSFIRNIASKYIKSVVNYINRKTTSKSIKKRHNRKIFSYLRKNIS